MVDYNNNNNKIKLLSTKNIIFLILFIVIINTFFPHIIKSEDKNLFITNDLDYINTDKIKLNSDFCLNKKNEEKEKENKKEKDLKLSLSIIDILDKQAIGTFISKSPKNLDILKPSNEIKKIENINKETFNPNPKQMYSFNLIENCGKKCYNEKNNIEFCIKNCIDNNKISKINEKNFTFIFIFLGILICLIISLALYINKMKNKNYTKDEFSYSIKRKLLDGYSLLNNEINI
jgi:hypothetical protein